MVVAFPSIWVEVFISHFYTLKRIFVQDTVFLPLTTVKSLSFTKVCSWLCARVCTIVLHCRCDGGLHWVLRIKFGSSGSVVCVCILWVMFMAPLVFLNYKIHKPLEFFLALKLISWYIQFLLRGLDGGLPSHIPFYLCNCSIFFIFNISR